MYNTTDEMFKDLGINPSLNTRQDSNGIMSPEQQPDGGQSEAPFSDPTANAMSFLDTINSPEPQQQQTKFTEHPLEWTAKRLGGGAANTIGSIGNAIQWLDEDNQAGKGMAEWGKQWGDKLMEGDDSIGAAVVSSVPFMVASWIPGLGTTAAVTRLATLAKVAPKVASLTGQALGTLTMTGIEAFSEAGNAYERAMQETNGNQQLSADRAQKTFWENSGLLGMTNAAELATSWGYFKKTPMIGRLASMADSIQDPKLRLGVKAVLSGGIEGSQEVAQNWIQDDAANKPFDLTSKDNVNAGAAGFILGGLAGGIGAHREIKAEQRQAQQEAQDKSYNDAINGMDLPDEVKQNLLGVTNQQDRDTLMNQVNATPQQQLDIEDKAGFNSFLNAISGQESGGNYDAVNERTGASGKYQIMPENWPSWAESAGLSPDAPMTAQNQEIVAQAKLRQLYDKYGPRGAAMAWYAGEGSLDYSQDALNRKQGNGDEPSINEYADSILAKMGNPQVSQGIPAQSNNGPTVTVLDDKTNNEPAVQVPDQTAETPKNQEEVPVEQPAVPQQESPVSPTQEGPAQMPVEQPIQVAPQMPVEKPIEAPVEKPVSITPPKADVPTPPTVKVPEIKTPEIKNSDVKKNSQVEKPVEAPTNITKKVDTVPDVNDNVKVTYMDMGEKKTKTIGEMRGEIAEYTRQINEIKSMKWNKDNPYYDRNTTKSGSIGLLKSLIEAHEKRINKAIQLRELQNKPTETPVEKPKEAPVEEPPIVDDRLKPLRDRAASSNNGQNWIKSMTSDERSTLIRHLREINFKGSTNEAFEKFGGVVKEEAKPEEKPVEPPKELPKEEPKKATKVKEKSQKVEDLPPDEPPKKKSKPVPTRDLPPAPKSLSEKEAQKANSLISAADDKDLQTHRERSKKSLQRNNEYLRENPNSPRAEEIRQYIEREQWIYDIIKAEQKFRKGFLKDVSKLSGDQDEHVPGTYEEPHNDITKHNKKILDKALKDGLIDDGTYAVAKELLIRSSSDISIEQIGPIVKATEKIFKGITVAKDGLTVGAHMRVGLDPRTYNDYFQAGINSIIGLFTGNHPQAVAHEFGHAKWYELSAQDKDAFAAYARSTHKQWVKKTGIDYGAYNANPNSDEIIKERFADEWSGWYLSDRKQKYPSFIKRIFEKVAGWFQRAAHIIDYIENSKVPEEIKTMMKKSVSETVETNSAVPEKSINTAADIKDKALRASHMVETGLKSEGVTVERAMDDIPHDPKEFSEDVKQNNEKSVNLTRKAPRRRKKKVSVGNNIAKEQGKDKAVSQDSKRHNIDPTQARNSLRDYSSVRFGFGSLTNKINQQTLNKLKEAGWFMEIDPMNGDTVMHRENVNQYQQKEFVIEGVVRKPDRHLIIGSTKDIIRRETSNVWDEIYTALVEDQHPIKILEKMDEDAKGLGDKLWYAVRGASSKALGYINYGDKYTVTDANGNEKEVTVKALDKILKTVPVKDWANFEQYAIAKRTLELYEKHKIVQSMTPEEAKEIIAKAEKNTKYEGTLKELVNFNNGLLYKLIDGGFITKEQFDYYVKAHEWYVPFRKDMSANNTEQMITQISNKKAVNIPDQIETIQSDTSHRLISPVKTMIEQAFGRISAIERNKVGQVLHKLANKPELADIIQEVKSPSSSAENVFHVWIDGQKKFIQTNSTLYNVLANMNVRQADAFTKLMSFPARWLRFGATSTPVFAVKNFTRDMVTAFMFSRHGFFPIYDSMRGLFEVFKGQTGKLGGSKLYEEWVKSGGAFSAIQSVDMRFNDYTNLAKDMIDTKTNKAEKAWEYLKTPFKAMMQFSEMMEQANRVAEFDLARKGHTSILNRLVGTQKVQLSNEEAALDSRDLTIDFQRAGTVGRTWNQYCAFFNAGIQGVDKFGRWGGSELRSLYNAALMKESWERPVDTAIKISAVIALTLMSRALMENDDRYKEETRSNKDIYWYFPAPNGGMIRIPKPFEVGMIFGSLTERALDFTQKKDPHAYDNLIKSLADTFTPPLIPNMMKLFLEPMVNYSFFTERKIVPDSEAKRPGYLQYGPYTSELAKKLAATDIAKHFDLSARKIDYLASSLGGTLGRTSMQAGDITAKNLPVKEWYETGGAFNVAGAFAYSGPKTSASVEQLYNRREALDKLKSEVDMKQTPSEPFSRQEYSRVNNAAKNISGINKKIKTIIDDPNMDSSAKKRYIEAYEKQVIAEAKKGLNQK